MANKTSYPFIIALIIAVTTFIVLSPSMKCDFVNYDDYEFVLKNNLVVNDNVNIKSIFSTVVVGNDYLPITILSLAWNYQYSKLDPVGFHLWNLILHVLNTLLVFLFIFILTKRNLLIAAIVAILFGIHPMHVESIAWVTERKDVLFLFFFMLGLISYLRYKDSRKTYWYFITFILFVLSCLSKGTAVVFPFILLLLDYLLLVKWNKSMLFNKIPFLFISFIFIVITFNLHKSGSLDNIIIHRSIFHSLLFAFYQSYIYIIKLLFPTNLSAYYPFPSDNNLSSIFYLSPFIVAGIVALIYRYLRKEKEIIFGISFYFISIFLMLQIIPTGAGNFMMADRYTYLSSIGLFYIIASLINQSWYNKTSKLKSIKTPLVAVLIIGIVFFSYQANVRTYVWKNSVTLWEDAIKKNPKESDLPYFCLGQYYLRKSDTEKALLYYSKAIDINPQYVEAYYNRGNTYDDLGKEDLAFKDYCSVISIYPKKSDAFANRANIYSSRGQLDSAFSDINVAIKYDLNNPAKYMNRADILRKRKQYNEAIEDYNKAVSMDANSWVYYYNRGIVFSIINQDEKAIADFTSCIKLNKKFDGTYFKRGVTFMKLKKYDEAIGDFSTAIDLKSTVPEYWYNRSIALKAIKKMEEARSNALKAQELGMKIDASYFDELGL